MSHWVVRNVWSHQYRLYSITHHLCAHFHRHNPRCPGDASSTADAAIDEWAAGKAQRVPFWAVYPVWNCGIAESYCWVESNGQYPWYQYKKCQMPQHSDRNSANLRVGFSNVEQMLILALCCCIFTFIIRYIR